MSRTVSILATAVASAIAFGVAAPAAAVITTFATFSAPTSAANLRFVNLANNANRSADASVYTTSTATGTTPGAAIVRFSFLQPELAAYVTNVSAAFTLNGTVAKNTPATLTVIPGFGTVFVQTGFSGTMQFLTRTAITVGGPNFTPTTYAIGSNLLTATFTRGSFSGRIGDSTGSSNESNAGTATLTFTSDFLDFTPTILRDASLALTSTSPVFAVGTGANKALRSFRTNLGGQFSSDPAPLQNGLIVVPEPEIWGMLVVGFGLVGFQARRRARTTVTA